MDLGITVIDDNFASAFLENNTSNGGFSSTCAKYCLRCETTGESRFHVIFEVGGLQSFWRSNGRGNNEWRNFGHIGGD